MKVKVTYNVEAEVDVDELSTATEIIKQGVENVATKSFNGLQQWATVLIGSPQNFTVGDVVVTITNTDVPNNEETKDNIPG